MYTKFLLLLSLGLWSILLLPLSLMAQNDIGGLFKSGPADATKLVNAYASPLFKGLGVGLNSGWTNTARAKKPLRFDLRITATAAFVPRNERSYDVNELGLESMRAVNKYESIGPTAFGNDKEGAEMEFYSNGYSGGNFRLPKGSGLSFVPSPQVQLTVGLLKHMDVSLRLVPKVKLGDDAGNLNLFGIAAKLELIPMLMGKKYKPTPIDIALTFGYTNVNYNIPLNINDQSVSNQVLDIALDGFNAEVIVSKNIVFFTPFASLGYQSATSHLRALGSYEFEAPTLADPNNKNTHINPVNIKLTNVEGLKASIGFQLQFSFFKLYGSYTQAKYSFINAGLGFAIGK